MRKKVIIKVTNFETQIIAKMLKQKAKNDELDLFVVERGESTLSDKSRRDLMTGYIGGSQDVCINYEPTEEEEEALCLKDRISLFDDDDERFSLLERVWFLVSNEGLTAFQRLVVAGSRGYIPALLDTGEFYYRSEKEMRRQIKNVLRGECISRGVSRQALRDAETAVKNKKVLNLYDGGTLTIVRYPYKDIGPVMDLLWNSYEDLVIQNTETKEETVFTSRKEMEQDLKYRYCYNDTWTTKRPTSTKWKIYCKKGGVLEAYKPLIKKKK
jgi:hypothetical protein